MMYGVRAKDLAWLIIRGWLVPTTGIVVILIGAYLAVGHIQPSEGSVVRPEPELRLTINAASMEVAYGSCPRGLEVVTWNTRGDAIRVPVTTQETHLPSTGIGPVVVMCGSQVSRYRGVQAGVPYVLSTVGESTTRREP